MGARLRERRALPVRGRGIGQEPVQAQGPRQVRAAVVFGLVQRREPEQARGLERVRAPSRLLS
ncbi:MAG: hypothetical protein OXK79_08465 [Chloroflexota bacterium]|nr:hypothetical protein [Chloroflexota bacterium]